MPAETTRRVLEILNRYNHKVAILTKGGTRCLTDLDLFKKFRERIKVGATLTFCTEKDSKKWEHGAAIPADRYSALKTLSENGIKTWVSFEPVIIPEQSLVMLSKVATFVNHVKIGKLNDYKGIDKTINWADFIAKAVEICRANNLPFYIKNDLAAFNQSTFLSENERNADYLSL